MSTIRKIFPLSSNRVTARWVVILVDLSLVLQTFFIAYLVRFNFTLDFEKFNLVYQFPLIAVTALISFFITGSYKGVVRYTGIRDAKKVLTASFLIAVILSVLVYLNLHFKWFVGYTIPRSIIAIHFLLNVVVLISSRFIFKYLYEILTYDIKKRSNALIYGAGDSGIITLNAIRNDRNSHLSVIGFIDDNKHKKNMRYEGVPVFHSSDITADFIDQKQVSEIIISIQNIAGHEMMAIVDRISVLPVKIKIVPPVDKWIGNNLKPSQISQVKIDDLLGRHPIDMNNPVIAKELYGKVIFVTGAAGSIGCELSRQISHYGYKRLILLDQSESALYDLQQELKSGHSVHIQYIVADIRDKERMEEIMSRENPDIIFHAAAYKHVPLMEENPYEAVSVNVFGTKNIMDLAVRHQVKKFVMISTDKAVNPTNVMGATKRIAEIYATYLNGKGKTQFVTTRFGNVLGSNGSVIPLFKKQLASGGPLRVTHKEITRFFMTIPEASQLVMEAAAMGKGGEIFVFDMGKSVKIFDLAKKIIQLSGYSYPDDIDIEIIGLRPGEKLYEEVLADKEKTLPTHHRKIKIAKVSGTDDTLLLEVLEELAGLPTSADMERVGLLKKLVPEYISNNSRFAHLDDRFSPENKKRNP